MQQINKNLWSLIFINDTVGSNTNNEDFVRSLFSIKFFVKLPCDFVSLPYFVSRSSFDFDDTVLATEALNFNAYLSTVANPVHLPNPSLSGGLVC